MMERKTYTAVFERGRDGAWEVELVEEPRVHTFAPWRWLEGQSVAGYEIRHGRTEAIADDVVAALPGGSDMPWKM